MTHLAIDLGTTSSFSEAVLFDPTNPSFKRHLRFRTTHADIRAMFAEVQPSVVIIESCRTASWTYDLFVELGAKTLVANTSSAAFQDASHRNKSDRLDAVRLQDLFLFKKLETVVMRSARAREEKQILELRRQVVADRTACMNAIRCLLDGVGLTFKPGKSGWTKRSLGILERWCDTAPAGVPGGFWQRSLALLLERFERQQAEVDRFDALIDDLQAADAGARQLQEVPGIGRLTSLAVSASIDDPRRFHRAKQVSRYSGLDPAYRESGKTKLSIGISRRSWSILRAYLFEACQIAIHRCREPWFCLQYERLAAKTGSKRKAICAIARRLYVLCWRMLKTGASWADVTADSLAAATPEPN